MGHPNQKKITLILPLCKLFKSVAKTGKIQFFQTPRQQIFLESKKKSPLGKT
jgi:hypothetical protein